MAEDTVAVEFVANNMLSHVGFENQGSLVHIRQSQLDSTEPSGQGLSAVGPRTNSGKKTHVTRFQSQNREIHTSNLRRDSAMPGSSRGITALQQTKPKPEVIVMSQRERTRRIAYMHGTNDQRFIRNLSSFTALGVDNITSPTEVKSEPVAKKIKMFTQTHALGLGLNIMRLR